MHTPRIDQFLAAETDLQPVLAKARDTDALSKLCSEILPPELARLTRVANYRDGKLVILAANGPAAAKLKLLSGGLCKTLSRAGRQVNSVSVRVQPTASSAPESLAKQAKMTAAGLSELTGLYARLRDSPTRKALKTLLDRHDAKPAPPDARTPSTREKAGPGRGRI